ncbi:glutathione S-transferase N-terminal domain-containing protein, partial [Streptococcus suis]
IALNLKAVEFESVNVDLRAPHSEQRKPDYLGLNPQGLVPVLLVEDTPIAQSLAIIEYLDETYPDPPLLPRSPVDRARVRAMALAVACDMHPL